MRGTQARPPNFFSIATFRLPRARGESYRVVVSFGGRSDVILSDSFCRHFVEFTPYFPQTKRLISSAVKLFNLLIHLTLAAVVRKGVASRGEGVYATGNVALLNSLS
jgi:hypothetical protein